MSDPHATISPSDVCRWCGHEHDPEDGRCDAHAHVGPGTCPCPGEGLISAYDKVNASLYVAERDCAELRGKLEDARAARGVLLAEQGVVLVDLREVVECLRQRADWHRHRVGTPSVVAAMLFDEAASELERRFGQEGSGR